MVNIDDAYRAHTTHKKKMMLMKTPDLQAARTAVTASAACWQLGERIVYRWRHRPRRGSDLRRGCSALAPLGGSPRGARPPARASSDHASDPPFVGAAVRGIIERQAALPSTRHPVRLRPQAGRQESRQAGQVDAREAQQGENPRADRAQAGGVRGRAHTCSPRRPKSLLMMPYE